MQTQQKEALKKELIQNHGMESGLLLYSKYVDLFEFSYYNECAVELIAQDISALEKISSDDFQQLHFYDDSTDRESAQHLRIYKWGTIIPLSMMLPILADFGFHVWTDRNYRISVEGKVIWISDYVVSYPKSTYSSENIEILFRDALMAICKKQFVSDPLNELLMTIKASWRELTILRAYNKYLLQTNFHFSEPYISKVLVRHPSISEKLILYFYALHDPSEQKKSSPKTEQIESLILEELSAVTSLDDDVIIRQLLAVCKATLRTNYFQKTAEGLPHPYLSLKFQSSAIPNLPLPLPLYEIFIYSPRFEGIHLRFDKVSRGGIRWSDRPEDFRREVFGLVKAQKVKNAIIVPSGAKGGFVLKALLPTASREEMLKEGLECYKLYIRALLGLTDNIKDGLIVHPESVVCHDEEDPYLVVAADKGTATFSDIANSISQEFGYWLGDAFASGGKTGYDHKKIGITARGAWESVKRHFCELGINLDETPVTMVGVGDMSGDVFGNGLIYSKNLKLIAAFDHRHIFLDPDPIPETSYQERLRLFEQAHTTWEDYSPLLISPGGGVYKRSAKSIPLSPQIKKVLDIQEDSLVPNELIRAILKSPVDLLWNGGIGTYVKASTEINADAGDKTNDNTRVNGNELRCKVVGEGGNLGFTQRGRIEYSLNKGLMNTDFIDNSAGVDCSDHEVNLKILLNKEVDKGHLSVEKRDELLKEVTDEVAALVLKENFQQAWILGYSNYYSAQNTFVYKNYIDELERLKLFNRKVEFLPDEKTFLERAVSGIGLTRPELAVLLAYTKIYIKSALLKSTVLEDPYFAEIITKAFPEAINARYAAGEQEHSLAREIKATQLSNRLVNDMGILFVYYLEVERGASVADILRAYMVVSAIFDAHEMQRQIEALDKKLPLSMLYELLYYVRHLVNISSRWFLLENRLKGDLTQIIEKYAPKVKQLRTLTMKIMTGLTQQSLHQLKNEFSEVGLPEDLAIDISFFRVAYTTLNIIEGAAAHQFDLSRFAKMYFAVGEHFNLVWFRDRLAEKVQEVSWESLTKLCLRDELDYLQKTLTIKLMEEGNSNTPVEEVIETWKIKHARNLACWDNLFKVLHESQTIDNSMYFVTLRKLTEAVKEHI